MDICKVFYPDEVSKSTYDIDFEYWYDLGYRGVIFDIDNTLVPHGADADDRSMLLFEKLHSLGFKTVLLSNNKKERVERFNKAIKTDYIYKAGKPGRKNYEKAVSIMKLNKNNTMFVGDQLFTDVWGAKRTGIYSILVEPMDPSEEIQIVLKRYLEKIVLHFYRRSKKR